MLDSQIARFQVWPTAVTPATSLEQNILNYFSFQVGTTCSIQEKNKNCLQKQMQVSVNGSWHTFFLVPFLLFVFFLVLVAAFFATTLVISILRFEFSPEHSWVHLVDHYSVEMIQPPGFHLHFLIQGL